MIIEFFLLAWYTGGRCAQNESRIQAFTLPLAAARVTPLSTSTKQMLKQAIRSTKLTRPQRDAIHSIIRVDQAGELGADYIYAGQHLVFSISDPKTAPMIKHMWDQEVFHHNTFDYMQSESRVRPSFFTPVWRAAAFGIGVGTALMGKKAAMACTEAVETVIGGHYNSQLRYLHKEFPELDESSEISKLKQTIKRFRDDELEHLNTAVDEGAKEAKPYTLLTETIKMGCSAAIWTAERF